MRARDMYKKELKDGKFNIPDDPGQMTDYAKTIEQIPPKYVPCKPGEIICQACSHPIDIEKDLSGDPKRYQYQLKNRLHDKCDEAKEYALDVASNEDPDRHQKVLQGTINRKPQPTTIDTVRF